jgi:hypothetical protein
MVFATVFAVIVSLKVSRVKLILSRFEQPAPIAAPLNRTNQRYNFPRAGFIDTAR